MVHHVLVNFMNYEIILLHPLLLCYCQNCLRQNASNTCQTSEPVVLHQHSMAINT